VRHETPKERAEANARAKSGRQSTLRNRAARETRPKPDLGAAMERLRVWMDERDSSGGEQT
jgi:hypothetical protein